MKLLAATLSLLLITTSIAMKKEEIASQILVRFRSQGSNKIISGISAEETLLMLKAEAMRGKLLEKRETHKRERNDEDVLAREAKLAKTEHASK